MTYDHEEVRCAVMQDTDHDTKLIGEPRTCCVCAGHGCAEALAAIAKRESEKAGQAKSKVARCPSCGGTDHLQSTSPRCPCSAASGM